MFNKYGNRDRVGKTKHNSLVVVVGAVNMFVRVPVLSMCVYVMLHERRASIIMSNWLT